MKQAFLYSLKKSIPILISFVPVGIAYGILMNSIGYNWLWTGSTSLFVFAGSLQFLMITFFTGSVPLITIAIMALLLNSRHIFYGIPFINKWKNYGFWKYFLIFALPDETFSLHVTNDFDNGNAKHKKYSYIFTATLVLFYWVFLSILGNIVGSFITFDTKGLDFALTALFIVILLEQIKGASKKTPMIIGLLSASSCLLVLGRDNFILPSLIITVALLILLKNKILEVRK